MSDLYRLTNKDGALTFTPIETPPPARVLFCSPVTGVAGDVWGAGWFDATGYGVYYTSSGAPAYHTGVDLNLPNYADAGKPVYATANGEVVFSGVVPNWQGKVIVIKHALEDDSYVCTRYAHVKDTIGLDDVLCGEQIAVIADYTPAGPKGDHLHYDVARIDLGVRPGDWPGLDGARLKRDYIDPVVWHTERAK